MKKLLLFILLFSSGCRESAAEFEGDMIVLPDPMRVESKTLSESINSRVSVRRFSENNLSLEQVSYILWAAGGELMDARTSATRSYPSAGGIYPLDFYLIVGDVNNIESGVYRYNHANHSLEKVADSDIRSEMAVAALGQRYVAAAPAVIAVAADFSRTESRYGSRAQRYVLLDAGHSGENISLAAASIGLGSVAIGSFDDERANTLLFNSAPYQELILLYPIGYPYR